MSQSRNWRPASKAREAPRAAPPPGYVTNEAKDNYGNKSTYKIPKNIRYDLENALVGLCDIWFEEIKPHLVKNKLKLHTGGALNEGGDLAPAREHRRDGRREEPRRAPGRALLDPDGSGGGELQNLLANAARGIESAVSQAALAHQADAAKSD